MIKRTFRDSYTSYVNLEISTCDLFKYKIGNPVYYYIKICGKIHQNTNGLWISFILLVLLGSIAQSEVSPTADPGVGRLIPAPSHTSWRVIMK